MSEAPKTETSTEATKENNVEQPKETQQTQEVQS